MLTRLKQFQCFISVLFHDVRTSEIKLEIKLFYFRYKDCVERYASKVGHELEKCYNGQLTGNRSQRSNSAITNDFE